MSTTANINTIATELLSRIFFYARADPTNGQDTIAQSRLVSRRFRDAASTFLITEIFICLNSDSFDLLEAVCSHPIISKGVRKVNILLSYY